METKGMKVSLSLNFQGQIVESVLRNVTEIHYNYPSIDTGRIAFESDIHGTGLTHDIADIAEMEVLPEIEITEMFW